MSSKLGVMKPMNEEKKINADACYWQAQQKAADYFQVLYEQVWEKEYVHSLTRDILTWKNNHIPLLPFCSNKKGRPDPKNYNNYIKWLDYTGKLENYLDRSISYIYMRDLGKALNSPETKRSIQNVVESLKKSLQNSTFKNKGGHLQSFNLAWIYRKAQEEGIESTILWLISKLKIVSKNIPSGMDADNAQRKLIKIIAGVLMHELEEMDDDITPAERQNKLDRAIRLGYSYGLTYPFIDDLFDANILTEQETREYANLIRITLINQSVPKLGDWPEENLELMRFVHTELRESFEYIKNNQRPDTMNSFFEQSYVFFHSQEVDRLKVLSNPNYSNEELYIPVILKSSSSRLIARSVIVASKNDDFNNRTFYYGIYNQLADDFADMFDDLKDGAVTPYTYYFTYHKKRSDLINPFELYWAVISHLIHHVYKSDPKSREVILDRAINGLKRFKQRVGSEKYNEIMNLFASGEPKLNRLIQKMVRKADDVDFFDKLLRDHMVDNLKKERIEQGKFLDTIEMVRSKINNFLQIDKNETSILLDEPLIKGANYSLEGGGKRLRPIITWFMGVKEYGFEESAIVPLLKSLEYMHTASLIFDDLPSQDNSPVRRGRPTLHKVHTIAVAELTALFLTQKAIGEQSSLSGFEPGTVLKLVRYSTKITEDMCMGQVMDLESKGKSLTLDQLNQLSFYKTGIAFEASIIMPAILANANESEMNALKKYARHAGIAFQIKDDLLDVEGDKSLLGKPVGLDIKNNQSTFVTILGVEDARKAMWDHYCLAIDALEEIPRNMPFLTHLLDYIVHRDR